MKIIFLCGIVENVLFYGTENGLTKKMRDRFDGIYTRMFTSLPGGLWRERVKAKQGPP